MNKISVKCECGRDKRYALVPINPATSRLMNLGATPGETTTYDAQAMSWAGQDAQSLTRQPAPYTNATPPGMTVTREEPAWRPTVASSVGVPLSEAFVTGALFGASVGTLSILLHGGILASFGYGVTACLVATCYEWLGSRDHWRNIIFKVEEVTRLDLNRDGHTGKPEKETVYTPMPINMRDKADSTPEPEPAAQPAPKSTPKTVQTTSDSLILIRAADKRKSARIVTLGELWSFMTLSFERDSWGRDAWQERGMGQKVWADYKMFLESFGWWKVADRPTLDLALRRFCYPVTNEPGNERTNEGETS